MKKKFTREELLAEKARREALKQPKPTDPLVPDPFAQGLQKWIEERDGVRPREDDLDSKDWSFS